MLELNLLGTPDVRLDGIAFDGSLFGKELALLYYLAVTGQPQPRPSLAVLLWGDLNDSASRGNLRKTLSLLRQSFDGWIVAEHDTIGLDPERVVCDVRRFEQLAQDGLSEGAVDKMQAAIDLYRGDFLAGFMVRNAPDYELWLAHTQERLRGIAVRLFDELAQAHRRRHAYAPAITCLQRILDLEPWREETHRQLMELLAADGQRGAALHQYERCVECLASELGVEPSAETEALYAHIRAGAVGTAVPEPAPDAAPRPVRRTHLPAELSPLVGRERELAELGAMLAQPDCRAITIVGPGGIGKTRLALALAHRQQANFAAAAWQSVAGLLAASDIVSVVVQAFDLDSPSGEDALDQLQRVDGRLLLVVDNFEHLLPGGVAELETLLTAIPGLVCIITSREALSASWEWRYAVDELLFPADAGDSNLGDYAAVQLFLQLARRTRPRYAIQRAELPDVVRICQLVGGLPLGIEFAAAHVGRLPCALIADNLAAGLDTLDAMQAEILRDLPPRQRSLVASFEASWRQLAPEEQRVLTTLSVLCGEFTVEAALAIAQTTAASIVRLVDKSLIRLAAVDRYALHEVIRRLAGHKLAEIPGAPEAAFDHYKSYYLALTKETLRALFARLNTTPDLRGYLQSLRSHLHFIWQRVAGGPDAAAAAVALSSAEMALTTFEMTFAGDTLLLLRQNQQTANWALPRRHDVVPLDIIWLPGMADDVLDLSGPLADVQSGLLPLLAQNCRIDGRLLAIPYVIEAGVLYYRRDLLEKYGFDGPPRTWAELERMAAHVQAHERAAGQVDFWGYIWQGYPSEHLMCNGLEWQHSEGGGLILDEDGTVTVNNAQTIAAWERARGWLGTISPPSVRTADELHTLERWTHGQAAFMRLWSVGYPVFEDTAVGDLTGVTVLPAGAARHAALLGGWPLAVRAASADPDSAVKLIRDIISVPAQRTRSLARNPQPPALRALYDDPDVCARMPHFRELLALVENGGLAIRPAKVAGRRYPQVSAAYVASVASVLYEGVDAAAALAQLATTLTALLAADAVQ